MLQEQSTSPSTALFSARELLRCDWSCETFVRAIRISPRECLNVASDVLIHRCCVSQSLAQRLPFDAASLLYDEDVMRRLNEARSRGLQIAIIPDLPAEWCAAIATHLGVDIYSSGFITSEAASKRESSTGPHLFHKSNYGVLRQLLRAIRVQQWPKNTLVFLPILLSHRFHEINLVVASLLAFLAIGFAASTIYVINDLMDIGSDRQHPSKSSRPFASGAIPARWGFALIAFTSIMAASIAAVLPPAFILTMAVYLIVNIVYTAYLKRKLLVDVLTLSGSYTLRILAGNAATGIELSFWLLAFSIFIFFSLALVKRYVEMDTIGVTQPNEKRVMGRGYRYVDLDMLAQMGVVSAFSAVLVLALNVERAGATGLYTSPELIWLICPIVLYVIARIWFLAKRGEMKDDPVAFILRDWRSHLMGAIAASILVAASW